MTSEIIKAIVENGIGVGLTLVISGILFFIIKHILKQSDKILDMAINQNASWQKVIDEHTSQARAFHENAMEAFKYIREEHKEAAKQREEHKEALKDQNTILSGFQKHCEKVQEDCARHQERLEERLRDERS